MTTNIDSIKLLVLAELATTVAKYDDIVSYCKTGYNEDTRRPYERRVGDVYAHYQSVYKIAESLDVPGLSAFVRKNR